MEYSTGRQSGGGGAQVEDWMGESSRPTGVPKKKPAMEYVATCAKEKRAMEKGWGEVVGKVDWTSTEEATAEGEDIAKREMQ